MAFGHGCVDDSEDADVVLHEYGHAINHDINPSWGGGDMGAIGEGWGDYWGASYSYGTENGAIFYKEWIFHWDGHGAGNWCWPGRVLNAFGAQYVHSQFYGAHQSIGGGYQSDELWSTPIYQTMLTCVEQLGQTKESVDRILLESQFGTGGGLKMRDMANVIIATAQALEPEGPHAQVFVEKFLVHNIILAPVPVVGVESFEVAYEPSGNGAADPGETVSVRVALSNNGLSAATGVSGQLTTAVPGVTITQDTAGFGDIAVGDDVTGDVDFEVVVDQSVACGTLLTFNLAVSYSDGGSPVAVDRHGQLFAGVPVGGYGIQTPYVPLPDDTGAEIYSTITISGTGAVVSEDINMDIFVEHDHVGDLVMWLTSPSGTRAYLTLLQGGSADDIQGNYPNTLTPAQSFDRFYGEPLDGAWELMVRDQGGGGTGQLNYWAFYDISDVDCDTDITATPDLPASFQLAQNAPNPFNPATTIAFDVPRGAGVVTLAIYDVSGRLVRTLEHGQLEAGRYTRTWQGRDQAGRAVASGVYFYKLSGDGFSQTRKMVVVQ
jgi:subtilisin-like proprotein convertase family protein